MEGNITYRQLIKVFFRLIGVYLVITGGLSAAVLAVDFAVKGSYSFYMLGLAGEMFTEASSLFVGLLLYAGATKLASTIKGTEKEISFRAGELSYLVFCVFEVLLTVFIVAVIIQFIGEAAVFVVIDPSEWSLDETYVFIVPVVALIFAFIMKALTARISRFVTK
ncbi:MAG: hypothetical protein K0Q63_1313 [Paenibacillus sp.]|jgi:hypothetical protein|nr:hypothetical protein [Paenibacillus sp.]